MTKPTALRTHQLPQATVNSLPASGSGRPLSEAIVVDWVVSKEPVDLPEAVAEMERRVTAIANGDEDEAVWLLEHPPRR